MDSAQTVICGAGITGLSLARELVRRGADSVLVLDKEPGPGEHASGRNSGVLHAGVYYAPGSLKARVCLAGNRAMKGWCRERGLPLLESGKAIVTRTEAELDTLRELHARASACGADVALVDEKELADIEPHARTVGQALYSRETAQVDPRAVVAELRRELEATGKVRFRFGVRALGPIDICQNDGILRTDQGPVAYEQLVNAAGAHADRLAKAFGAGRRYSLVPFKGVYRRLKQERAHLCRGNIYPVPDILNPFLGVHFTRSVGGSVYLGPTAIPVFGRENYAGPPAPGEALSILARDAWLFFRNAKFRKVALTEPRKYRARSFFADARKLVPELRFEDLEPTPKAGIRPQLIDTRSGELVMDFVLEKTVHELHVLNAISPAFTASFAFAELLADRLET